MRQIILNADDFGRHALINDAIRRAAADGLLRSADMAMYESKRAGRQQYRFYDQELNGRARSRLMLEDSVRELSSVRRDGVAVPWGPEFAAEPEYDVQGNPTITSDGWVDAYDPPVGDGRHALHHHGDQAGADVFIANQLDVGGFTHRVRRFDTGNQTFGFNQT